MANTRYFSVLIVPDDGAKTTEIRIARRTVRGVVIALLVFGLLLILSAASYWKVAGWALQARELMRRNIELETENRKIKTLTATLERIKVIDGRLRKMLEAQGERTFLLNDPDESTFDERPHTFVSMIETGPSLGDPERIWQRLLYRPSIWPVEGCVLSRLQKGSAVLHRNEGIDILARPGSVVRATADGRVTFAGWDEHLGNLMEIDHGGFFTTRYGGTARLLVTLGERVQSGQSIALLGRPTQGKPPYLHYEVLEDGGPKDPMEYFLRP